MKLHRLMTGVAFLFLGLSAIAAETKRIVLNDGTAIIGEVVGLQNGSYTIRSETLGTIKLSDRQVAEIRQLGGVNPVESAQSSLQGSAMESVQQRLLNSTDTMQQIMRLQTSPEMQAILSDPEIMSAVQRLDMEALRNNPKIQQLMNNPQVRSITGAVN